MGCPSRPGPVPVGQHVHHRLRRPLALVEVEAVLREPGEVHDPEVGAARGPVLLVPGLVPREVRGRLAQVIEPGPHELAEHGRRGLEPGELDVRAVGPGRRDDVVSRQLERRVLLVLLDRQVVDPARADAGGRLRAHDRPPGVVGEDLRVLADAVVEAGDVHLLGQAVLDGVLGLVEPGGHGPRRVLLVADVGEALRHLPALRLRLLEDLVPDAPHHDARVVAVPPDHVAEVALSPLGEVLAVAVLHLRHAPHVEGLVHDEEAHAVGGLEQLRSRRVVARADGVRAHALQDLELALDRAPVDGRAQRAEVVVVAHALQRDATAVQEEALVGAVLDRPDAEGRLVPVENGVARASPC